MSRRDLKVVLLAGPTAVGKTALAIELAGALGGEIISADSRLFYRGMDIGTAKPSEEELRRVPHHLIDVADPDEHWNLARFLEAVDETVADIHRSGKLPLIVGGTGQFVKALLEGWEVPELNERPEMREMIGEIKSAEGLHQWLKAVDPEAAARIDARNVRRTIRAIEVILSTGTRFSEQRKASGPRYDFLVLALTMPRDELYARIDRRVDEMFSRGFLGEVNELLSKYPDDLKSFSAIGYPQAIRVIRGEMTEDEARAEIKKRTRVFVRRQGAWFRDDLPGIQWIAQGPDAVGEASAAILQFLGQKGD